MALEIKTISDLEIRKNAISTMTTHSGDVTYIMASLSQVFKMNSHGLIEQHCVKTT
jgi:hypothetical protein